MRTYCLIAVGAFLLSSGAVVAEPVVLHSDRVTVAITLQKATPSSIMWGLGLFTLDDLKSGSTQLWRADQTATAGVKAANGAGLRSIDPTSGTISSPAHAPSIRAMLPGIDMMEPRDAKHVLVVRGDKAGVEQFKSMVALLDVAAKKVQAKIEVFRVALSDGNELALADGNKLDFDKLSQTSISTLHAAELRESLRRSGAEFLSSPILTTFTSVPGEVSESSDTLSWLFCELPRTNADNTITLTLQTSVSEPGIGRGQELFTQRRIASGESVLIGGFRYGEDKSTMTQWFLLTAKIVK